MADGSAEGGGLVLGELRNGEEIDENEVENYQAKFRTVQTKCDMATWADALLFMCALCWL